MLYFFRFYGIYNMQNATKTTRNNVLGDNMEHTNAEQNLEQE